MVLQDVPRRWWAGGGLLALCLACWAAPAAVADAPLATIGSTGQTTLCTNNEQSSVNPGATTTSGLLGLASGPCTTASAASTGGGSGTGSTAAGGSSDQGGGGGGGTAANDTASTNTGSTNTASTSTQSSTAASSRSSTTTAAAAKPAAKTVAAAGASGVKVVAVHFRQLADRRLRVEVTVRDRYRRLVRSAIVSLGGVAGAKSTLGVARSTFTNRNGQASFSIPLTAKLSGKRLLMRVTARTPRARAAVVSSKLILQA